MLVGDYIQQYRRENEMSMDDFANKANLSKGYIAMLEKNKNSKNGKPIVPSISTIAKIANATNISFDDLFCRLDKSQKVIIEGNNPMNFYGGNIEVDLKTGNETVHPLFTSIKVYSSVHAGFPQEAEENIIDWEEIPKDWTRGGQEYIGIKVQGDCMEPKYLEGDTILVRLQEDCESGQDAVVYVNGYESQLRRLIKKDYAIILQPINSEYLPDKYYINDPDNPVVIVGVVVEIRRKV
jgi:SOS-response transcriptional repressor LexA